MESVGREFAHAEKRSAWRGIGLWSLVIVGAMLSYVLISPVIYFLLEPVFEHWDWIEDLADVVLAPLYFLYETIPVYESYVDWIDDLVNP